MAVLSKDRRPDDGMLHVGHRRSSVLDEKGQSELMGSIHCTRIPFILVVTSRSHHSPLSLLYSADPLVDPKTHSGIGTVELFFVMILTIPPMLMNPCSMFRFSFVTIMSYCTFLSQS